MFCLLLSLLNRRNIRRIALTLPHTPLPRSGFRTRPTTPRSLPAALDQRQTFVAASRASELIKSCRGANRRYPLRYLTRLLRLSA